LDLPFVSRDPPALAPHAAERLEAICNRNAIGTSKVTREFVNRFFLRLITIVGILARLLATSRW
jgi:hypothetical protein